MQLFSNNWERIVFTTIGFSLLCFSFYHIWQEAIANASVTFGMAFFCFIYSTIARFKRFKGLGFEAELWEDKKLEAANLIDRLKDIVEIYSREAVMNRIKRGRWGGDASQWASHWQFFDDLVDQHINLGQTIDLSDLQKEIENYFVFDMVHRQTDAIWKSITDGKTAAQKVIDHEFGNPIQDAEGYGVRMTELNNIQGKIEDPFKVGQTEDIAKAYIELFEAARATLLTKFQVNVKLDPEVIANLTEISAAQSNRPIKRSERLISLADGTAK